jgi:hypothetical protein
MASNLLKCIYQYEQEGIRFQTQAVFKKGQYPAQSVVSCRFPEGTSKEEVEKHFQRFIRVVFKDLVERGAKVRQ